MGPDTYFVRKHKPSQRRKVVDADGVVHIGKPLHKTRKGARNAATNFFEPRCAKGVQLYLQTEEIVTCVICLGMT